MLVSGASTCYSDLALFSTSQAEPRPNRTISTYGLRCSWIFMRKMLSDWLAEGGWGESYHLKGQTLNWADVFGQEEKAAVVFILVPFWPQHITDISLTPQRTESTKFAVNRKAFIHILITWHANVRELLKLYLSIYISHNAFYDPSVHF